MNWRVARGRMKPCYSCITHDTFSVRCTTLVLGLSVCLFLNACPGGRRQSESSPTAKPVLSASPNPVPAGDPDQPVASTQISWDTGDATIGDLYVKIDREDERLVGSAPSGVMNIDWIQFDSLYEFRLYAKKRSKLLASLTVTRDD
jgi:hypothetical protein